MKYGGRDAQNAKMQILECVLQQLLKKYFAAQSI